jgi:hypothetical protein
VAGISARCCADVFMVSIGVVECAFFWLAVGRQVSCKAHYLYVSDV